MNVNRLAILVICFALSLIVIPSCVISCYTFGWFSETALLTKSELGPTAILHKYAYLKAVASQLAAKKNSIVLADKELARIRADYSQRPVSEWPRDERESFRQRQVELDGLKLSYNNLTAEYNQLMSQFNWRFSKLGELPYGCDEVLPGEGTFALFERN